VQELSYLKDRSGPGGPRRAEEEEGGEAAVLRPAGAAGETGRLVAVARDAIYSVLEWVPQSRGWGRDPLYRGDGEKFLVHGEKEGRG
jgi:hypothetical protein